MKRILKEKTLELAAKQAEESSNEETEESSSEQEKQKWDVDTIVSTYTNTDNHPHLIKYVPKIKTN